MIVNLMLQLKYNRALLKISTLETIIKEELYNRFLEDLNTKEENLRLKKELKHSKEIIKNLRAELKKQEEKWTTSDTTG